MGNNETTSKVINMLTRGGIKNLVTVVFLSVISSVLLSVTPVYISSITAHLTNKHTQENEIIFIIGAMYVVTLGIQKCLQFLSVYCQSHLRIDAIVNISHLYLQSLYERDKSLSPGENTGDISHKLNQATNDIYVIIRVLATNLFPSVLQVLISVVFILNSGDIFTSILFLLYTVIFISVNTYFSKRILKSRKVLLDSGRKTYSLITDSVKNLSLVRSMNTFDFFFSRFRTSLENDRNSQRDYWNLNIKSQVTSGILNLIVFGLVFFKVLNDTVNGIVPVSHFILITSYIFLIINPLEGLAQSIIEFKEARSNLKDFLKNLTTDKTNKSLVTAAGSAEICAKEIEYRYNTGDTRQDFKLGPINLTLKPGIFYSLTGENGSGKSTFIKILTRQIKNYHGSLTIGIHDYQSVSDDDFYNLISYVSQDDFIFMDTLRFNLQIANPHATEEEMLQALEAAGLNSSNDREILDRSISDSGSDFSGGQRQKLSLARLLLRSPEIIILDEVSSSMDVQTEEHCFRTIRSRFPDATIINITHRPASLILSDEIIVFCDGRIVESGSVAELMNTGHYISDLMRKYASDRTLSEET
ncbi:TPA: ATP-binding cassette domain-containing protein [Klebsiella aerogenes]|uniref:ABC transporter ATP-binding protein n=1 Tax=Klebsiella aerogenes TaxID=548 RepID=UPI00277BADCA|nr:ATP-binding cassette domain-containing protein [Klebsiella aerogenes]HDS7500278.1 ATP-binding cassette domain-containing protein [Klebsiella aerogenes]HDT1124618.1 ATP-binding cassette domain-containing protein [Klebsiella aerogenes]